MAPKQWLKQLAKHFNNVCVRIRPQINEKVNRRVTLILMTTKMPNTTNTEIYY